MIEGIEIFKWVEPNFVGCSLPEVKSNQISEFW